MINVVHQVDPDLAMAEADKVEDDEDLRKKLWLMIAKHVIQQEKGVKRENIRKAIAFLKETNGLLKIEDILPFFPDFALIDDFKVRFLELTFIISLQLTYIMPLKIIRTSKSYLDVSIISLSSIEMPRGHAYLLSPDP